MNPEILNMIRCPISKSDLKLITEQELESLNQGIAKGEVFDQMGRAVSEPVENALINADRRHAMAVRGGIVTLIADEAIVLEK